VVKRFRYLWQIHTFGEGNTRTTAVFLIEYLRTLGYDIENDMFANNAWYFRNALVRANYTNIQKDIYETTEYLELFLRNLLLGENNELKNRYKLLLICNDIHIKSSSVNYVTNKYHRVSASYSQHLLVTLYRGMLMDHHSLGPIRLSHRYHS